MTYARGDMRKVMAMIAGSGLTFAALSQGVGCSDSTTTATPNNDAGTAGGNFELELDCKDTAESIYADPGKLPDDKGAIIRCTKDAPISMADLQAKATANGYKGKPFTSGAKVYRVLYRTERGDAAKTAGYSSAFVFIPEKPRAEKTPVVVASRGSRGQGPKCTPSKLDPAGAYVQGDFERQVYPLVGSGLPVIAPDLAGYANFGAPGNTISVYASAADVGKSTLDGVKALRKLIGKSLTEQIVITGHSQGGHTALSALALSSSYGVDGKIAGLAVYSPLWLSQRSWGAIFLLNDQFKLTENPGPVAVSVWYHYTHGELLDGPGKGVDVFAADKREGIKKFVENTCWSDRYPDLEALGNTAKDLFDPAYVTAIQYPAGGVGDCGDNLLCKKWMDRFVEDRPTLTGEAAKVPIVVLYGGEDTTIPPPRAQCVFDKLKADNAKYSVCIEPTGGHGSVVDLRADYVNDWIAARTLGGTEPAACNAGDTLTTDAGAPVKCQTPPPND